MTGILQIRLSLDTYSKAVAHGILHRARLKLLLKVGYSVSYGTSPQVKQSVRQEIGASPAEHESTLLMIQPYKSSFLCALAFLV